MNHTHDNYKSARIFHAKPESATPLQIETADNRSQQQTYISQLRATSNINNALDASFASLNSLSNCFHSLDAKSHAGLKPLAFRAPASAAAEIALPAGRKKRTKKSKESEIVAGEEWKCVQCGAGEADTPLKRKGPDRKRNYCNACYVRWRVKVERSERGSARPVVPNSGIHTSNYATLSSGSEQAASETTSLREKLQNTYRTNNGIPTTPHHMNHVHNSSYSRSGSLPQIQYLSFTSPTQATASMTTTIVPVQTSPISSTESPSSVWIQSPAFTSYEWNTMGGIHANATPAFFPSYFLDSPHKHDASMHSGTTSPAQQMGGAMVGISQSGFEMGQVPKGPMFDFGISQASLFDAADERRLDELGVSLDLWNHDTFAHAQGRQPELAQMENGSQLQQQIRIQQLQQEVRQQQHETSCNHLKSLSNQNTMASGIMPPSLGDGISNSNPVKQKSWTLDAFAAPLESSNDPTYLPVFDGSTTDINYNQMLGYGADVSDPSTHEFLYGGTPTGGIPGTYFPLSLSSGEKDIPDDALQTAHAQQQYQYEPVSHFLLREGYDFDSGIL
ncbi:hypothetical protein BC830DRAFT_368615 [Chytriomyces sp. MP71]|nr:hypothetical protein BC830DRAFT_368615 [Chytriomyces sp. MP71]